MLFPISGGREQARRERGAAQDGCAEGREGAGRGEGDGRSGGLGGGGGGAARVQSRRSGRAGGCGTGMPSDVPATRPVRKTSLASGERGWGCSHIVICAVTGRFCCGPSLQPWHGAHARVVWGMARLAALATGPSCRLRGHARALRVDNSIGWASPRLDPAACSLCRRLGPVSCASSERQRVCFPAPTPRAHPALVLTALHPPTEPARQQNGHLHDVPARAGRVRAYLHCRHVRPARRAVRRATASCSIAPTGRGGAPVRFPAARLLRC